MTYLKLICTTFVLLSALMMQAQIVDKPSLSPRVVTEQRVGIVNVKLDYGQPNMQNRKVFGVLIPYDRVWRTGANSATKISFDRDIKLAQTAVPAGDYTLYTIPGKKEWTIIIHQNTKLWGDAGYDKANDLVRFKVPVTNLQDTNETLRIHFENFHTNGGDLVIAWENTKVVVPLFVDSDEIIYQEIATKVKAEEVSAQTYFEAAQFYYLKGKDLDTAMTWFDKAIELKPSAFWFVYYKAELALHLKQYDVAEKNNQKCLAAAKANEASDFGYIAKCTLLSELIAEAKK